MKYYSKTIYVVGNRFGIHYSRNHVAGATKWQIRYAQEQHMICRLIGNPVLLESNIYIDDKVSTKIEQSDYWLYERAL